jgi:peptidoglycan/xylan/chitin deacetylase (PgdA/CDA1 family)
MADQFNLDDPDQARAAYHSLRATFIETDLPTRSSLLERIVGDLAPSESPPRLLMSWEEAREIRRQYPRISFGVHGAEHLDLTAQSPDVVAADLDACKEDFEREIGESPQHFAYPYNRSNESSRGNLRERGFRSAMTSGTDVLVGSHTDALGIPRLDAPTDFQLLSHWTLGAFYSRRAKVH